MLPNESVGPKWIDRLKPGRRVVRYRALPAIEAVHAARPQTVAAGRVRSRISEGRARTDGSEAAVARSKQPDVNLPAHDRNVFLPGLSDPTKSSRSPIRSISS